MYGPEELLSSPMFQEEPPAPTPFAYTTDAQWLREGQTQVLRTQGAGTLSVGGEIPVAADQQYFLTIEVASLSGDVSFGLQLLDDFSAEISFEEIPVSSASTYLVYRDTVTIPAGATSAVPQIRTISGTDAYVAYVSVRRKTSATSTHGWYITAVRSLIVNSLSVQDPLAQDAAVTIDSAGVVSALQMHASDSLTYQGVELNDLLSPAPRGLVSWAGISQMPSSRIDITGEIGITELSFTMPDVYRERRYRIGATAMRHAGTGRTIYKIRYTEDGSAPTVTSPEITVYRSPAGTLNAEFNILRSFITPVGSTVRLLLTVAPESGTTTSWWPDGGAVLYVEDVGAYAPPTGIVSSGGGGGGTPTQTKTSAQTNRKWDQTFKGDGSHYSYDNSKNYQGYYLSSNGVLKTAIGAPDQMFTDLAGATVEWIKVYLYADHWHAYSGGTAVIGVHGNATKPTTFPGINKGHQVNFSRDQGIWVTLPSAWYDSFKSQSYRGITLHANNSTSSQYYGYFTAAATKWQWKYTK